METKVLHCVVASSRPSLEDGNKYYGICGSRIEEWTSWRLTTWFLGAPPITFLSGVVKANPELAEDVELVLCEECKNHPDLPLYVLAQDLT